jgi:hypothetical protein
MASKKAAAVFRADMRKVLKKCYVENFWRFVDFTLDFFDVIEEELMNHS